MTGYYFVVLHTLLLLCQWEAAYSEVTGFSWGDDNAGNENSNLGDACLTDKASCGCCLMQQQIYRMKEFFNMSLIDLEKELTKTKTVINNIRASRSAFSVALSNDESLTCIGTHRDDMLIVFKHVFLNLGDGYNVNTGIFTVALSGVYSLALTVYSDAGSPGDSLAACAGLQVNGQLVAEPRDRNMQDQEDSATIVVALQLKAGDRVAVNLPIGCFLCDNNSHYNTFTGFLLYATD